MKLPSHPAIDFIREYWVQILVLLLFVSMAIANVVVSMENRVLKATLKNSLTTIKNHEDAAKANLATIKALEDANKAWSDAAVANQDLIAKQSAIIAGKESQFKQKEETLKSQLEKAHAQNKVYSDAVVPSAISDRLRQNSRTN